MNQNNTKQNKIFVWIIIILCFANLFVWLIVNYRGTQGKLEVTFFDVGQGDAAFIQTPEGEQILIDGGPNAAILEKLSSAMPFWDHSIDMVILSHPESDHMTGLFYVLANYDVKTIVWSEIDSGKAECKKWQDLTVKEGAQIIRAVSGTILPLDNNPADYIEILAPSAGATASVNSQNEVSVIAKLVWGQRSFLFTGDSSIKEERALKNNSSNLDADVLKIPHHGSKYSTDNTFLADVLPSAAVISVGAGNSYGHPNPEVLNLLEKYGIITKRTDTDGDITFLCDGLNIYFELKNKF